MDFRPFATVSWPPPKALVDAMVEHINHTGEPETFGGLHKGPVDKAAPFLIVRDISVPRGKRADGKMAPCPMCQPNKFYEGKLVWLTDLQSLAVIGHCCAASETRLEAEREYRERTARERAADYLLDNLAALPQHLSDCADLGARVAATQEVHDRFRTDGARFLQLLRRATKDSGSLVVEEVINQTGMTGPSAKMASGSTVQTRRVSFGRLTGRAAIGTRCGVAADYQRAVDNLQTIPSLGTEDAILEFLASLSDAQLVRYSEALREGVEGLRTVREALDEVAAFFTEANARRITEWGAHRDATDYLRAKLGPSGIGDKWLFEIVGRNRRVGVLIPPEFWREGKDPDRKN